MSNRSIALTLTFSGLLFIFSELLFRTALTCFDYPFFRPSGYLEKKYYPFITTARQCPPKSSNTRNILILGGSVVNTHWSRLEIRLDTLFQKGYPKIRKFNFVNVAMPGHNSLDNRIKYNMLKKQRFDLVIFYEGINENRANNITPELFRPDYGHIKWYDEINMLASHPEMNITVMPYALHFVYKMIKNKLTNRVYISNEQVDPQFSDFGEDIKTAAPYYANLSAIADLAKQKHEPLLLIKYASYFPAGVKLTGEIQDKRYFTPCYVVSPVTTWGKPASVIKGIKKHNEMLTKVSHENKTYFLDMAAAMPKDSAMFCDVCHLSEPGAQHFARQIADYVVSEKILQ